MSKLFGSMVDVYIKKDADVVSGVVVDIDDEFVYIQKDVNIVITIPKDNIKYYVSTNQNNAASAVNIPKAHIQNNEDQFLSVFVDKELVSEIPVGGMDLSVYSGEIMKVALANPEVHEYLEGKIQTSGEYFPGKLYIETMQTNSNAGLKSEHSFEMSGGGGGGNRWASQFMTPTETVTQLNSAFKKAKKGEEEPK